MLQNNLISYNVTEPETSSWKVDSEYITNLCKLTFDLNVEIEKSFRPRKTANKYRPLLIRFNSSEPKNYVIS